MHAFVVPFRDRGTDPLRQANLDYVVDYLTGLDLGPVSVCSDGLDGDAQFNRSRAYNNGLALIDADVFTFCESDMIVSKHQLTEGISLADQAPGLVVPFISYYYISNADSMMIRNGTQQPHESVPESVMDFGSSVGAVNTLSRGTIAAIGQWDEIFEGSWYDDRAMALAFTKCCGPTRFINGVVRHLYHLPGWEGPHLTTGDKAATRRNRERLRLYMRASTPARVRELTAGATQ